MRTSSKNWMNFLLVICFFLGVYDYIPLNHEYLGNFFLYFLSDESQPGHQ